MPSVDLRNLDESLIKRCVAWTLDDAEGFDSEHVSIISLASSSIEDFRRDLPVTYLKRYGRDYNRVGYEAAVRYLLGRGNASTTPTYTFEDLVWCRSQRFIHYGRNPSNEYPLMTDWLVHLSVYRYGYRFNK